MYCQQKGVYFSTHHYSLLQPKIVGQSISQNVAEYSESLFTLCICICDTGEQPVFTWYFT